MLTIWKYKLGPQPGRIIIPMPPGADFLSARETGTEEISVWARVDDSAKPESYERRAVEVCYTGHLSADDRAKFLGACILEGGAIVAHVFAWD